MLSIGNWLVDPETCTLSRDDEHRKVSPRAMDVLVCLAENAPQVVSVESLLTRFWPPHSASDHAVHKVLATLRQALGDTPSKPAYIKTFPKRGYAIIAEVETLDPAGAARTITPSEPEEVGAAQPSAAWPRRRLLAASGLVAACVLLLGLSLRLWPTLPEQDAASRRILAIQPVEFLGSGQDSEQSFLVLGLDAALTANLSQLPGLGIQRLTGPGEDEQYALSQGASHLFQSQIIERESDLLVHVELTDLRAGTAVYSDQLTVDAAGVLNAQEQIVANVVGALRIVLDEKQRAAMLDWGTASPLAYEQFIRAEFFKDQWNHADWEAAIAHYRKAIELDPLFVSAYTGLATAINYMSVYSAEQTATELQGLLAQYTRRLELARPGDPAVDILKTVGLTSEGLQIRDLANLYQQRIASGQAPQYIFAQFGLLLQGARLYKEADQYLARARAETPYQTVPNQQANFRTGSLTPWEAIPVKKRQLFEQPRHIGILGSLVRSLALTGHFQEAEYYFERQRQVDAAGVRSHLSKITMAAASGELFRQRSLGHIAAAGNRFRYPELLTAEALSDPELRFNNGLLELILGDIQAAAGQWRNLSPVDQRRLYTRLHASEYLIADSVLRDPAYHRLLERLGVGRSWQRQLMEAVIALEPMTAISLSEQAREAYAANIFMSHNNYWSEAQWRQLQSLKPSPPLRIPRGMCSPGAAEYDKC